MKNLLLLPLILLLTACPSVGTVISYMPTSECGKLSYDRDNTREPEKAIVIYAECPR
jgi:hypothetical protein